MISEKMQEALNGQIREEVFSAYLYWSMSAYFEGKNLGGYGSWFRTQAIEEMAHAEKFFKFVLDRGGAPILQSIDAPPAVWDSPLAAWEDAYKHECHISSCINKLVAVAKDENDNATRNMLEWFVNEQVEEEKTADEQVQNLKLIADNGYGLLMLDREAAQRVFAAPAAE